MNRLPIFIIAIAIVLTLTGCAVIGHKTFYSQRAPMKFTPTSNVSIFEYSNVEIEEIYNLLFSDFLVIGESAFIGAYEPPSRSASYARSLGADVFITTSQFSDTKTSFMSLNTPTTSTTYVSGYNGNGPVYGTATTYGTQTSIVPISVNRYSQDGMYLKNIDGTNPLWMRTRSQYVETGINDLSGVWQNESYQIEILQSGEQLVAFITAILDGDKSWSKEELKMIFGIESGVGIYLMGNKTPMPSTFQLNRFGFLEVTLLTNSEAFSFARVP